MSSNFDSQNSDVNPAQLSNYTHWINSHLKKRPGVKLIENLPLDIVNGVALIHLIEVICRFLKLKFFILNIHFF